MSEDRVHDMISHAYSGRLATVGPDGWPYIAPLLYVWTNGEIWVHNPLGHGHLRRNVDREPGVCFELDAPGEVFAYGRFECDTSIALADIAPEWRDMMRVFVRRASEVVGARREGARESCSIP
jgi:hypothetical protein